MRLIAIGDILGCYNALDQLLAKINPGIHDKLIFLGDYIDRGPDSKKVLDRLIKLREQNRNIVCLLGNHEKLFIDAMISERAMTDWRRNSGKATTDSFKCNSAKEVPHCYIRLIEEFDHYHIHENYIFVHAGLNEEDGLPFADKEAMLWIRKENYMALSLKDKIIVHGHTPIPISKLHETLKSGHNVINLDTGCAYTNHPGLGNLTAYDLSNSKIISVPNTPN